MSQPFCSNAIWPELYHMATLKLEGRLGKRATLPPAWKKEEADPSERASLLFQLWMSIALNHLHILKTSFFNAIWANCTRFLNYKRWLFLCPPTEVTYLPHLFKLSEKDHFFLSLVLKEAEMNEVIANWMTNKNTTYRGVESHSFLVLFLKHYTSCYPWKSHSTCIKMICKQERWK